MTHQQMQNVKSFRSATEELLHRNPAYLEAERNEEELLALELATLSRPRHLRHYTDKNGESHFTPVIYCRVLMASLGVTEVLFSFAMSAIQMTFSIHLWKHLDWYDVGDCTQPLCDAKHVERNIYLEFGIAACVCSVVAGSTGFFAGKENMKPRSRFWLYVVAIVVITGSFGQTLALAIINAQTVPVVTGLARNLSDSVIMSDNYATEKDRIRENLDYIYSLKIAMIIMYFILSGMLLTSDGLFIMNIIRNKRRYKNRKDSLFDNLAPLRPLGPEETLMDRTEVRRSSSARAQYANRSILFPENDKNHFGKMDN